MSEYGNFAEDIEKAADGEDILGIVIGQGDGGASSMAPYLPDDLYEVVLSWKTARPWLDRTYFTGFGGADCYPIVAWTAGRVIYVDEYDGATTVCSLPRNPTPCNPGF